MLTAAIVGGCPSRDLGSGEQTGLLADGNEPDARSYGHGAAENETARLDARNLRRGGACSHTGQMFHDRSKRGRIPEQPPHVRVAVDPAERSEDLLPHNCLGHQRRMTQRKSGWLRARYPGRLRRWRCTKTNSVSMPPS